MIEVLRAQEDLLVLQPFPKINSVVENIFFYNYFKILKEDKYSHYITGSILEMEVCVG